MTKKLFIENFKLTFTIWVSIWLLDIILTFIAITYYGAREINPISAFLLKFGWITPITISLIGIAFYCWLMGCIHRKTKNKFVKALPLAFYIWLLGTHLITVISNIIELKRLVNLN